MNVHKRRFAKAQYPPGRDDGGGLIKAELDKAAGYQEDDAEEEKPGSRFMVEGSSDSITIAKQRLFKQRLSVPVNQKAEATSRLNPKPADEYSVPQ